MATAYNCANVSTSTSSSEIPGDDQQHSSLTLSLNLPRMIPPPPRQTRRSDSNNSLGSNNNNNNNGGVYGNGNTQGYYSSDQYIIFRQAEEIRRLRNDLLNVRNERDALQCEVQHLKMEILAGELGRLDNFSLNESLENEEGCNGNVDDDEEDECVSIVGGASLSDANGHHMGTCVDDDMDGTKMSIYSSSEMTRISSSSSSSSASSSPVLFASSQSSSSQFHDSTEETVENGVVVQGGFAGPPARDAALVIQRAFRRYSMVKEFQRIKTERRLSRRINNNVLPTVGTNGCEICVDLHESHHQHQEEISGEEEEDSSIHSGELSRSPCPDVTEVDIEVDHVRNCSESNNSHHLTSSHSSPQMMVSMNCNGVVHGNNDVTSSRLTSHHYNNGSLSHNGIPSHHIQQQYQMPPLQQQQPLTSRHIPYQAHPQQRIYYPTGSSSPSKSSPNHSSSSFPCPSPGSPNNMLILTSGSPNSHNLMGVNKPQLMQPQQRQLSDAECEIVRKRLYRVGLNLFNKKPEVGVSYLVKKKFLEGSASAVSRFLISRKGLSKQMIGEYLANLQSPFSIACLEHFANEIDLSKMPIDLALRRFQTFLRMPGEAQKIERVMETFSRRYGACNPHITSQFRNGADTVFVLAFAIIMLNTDLHTPHLKADRRMKMEDFIKNLRGIDEGADIAREMLVEIYERIKQTEFRTGSDHVTQVMKVQQTIVGKKPNLALPYRRLVCYCRLYEVADANKREKSGSHQREVFLFNDTLVLTKIFHKKRNSVTYSFRQSYPLVGVSLVLFSTQHFEFGMSLRRGETILLNLNARNEHDRAKFAEDLREAIAESDEMSRIENLSKENRDSGVDVGKIKRFSNSLLDINDQYKPTRRGSCGSLDSGMSISFHSEENHQGQQVQQHSGQNGIISHHQHQGSSCSNSSTSTTHSK